MRQGSKPRTRLPLAILAAAALVAITIVPALARGERVAFAARNGVRPGAAGRAAAGVVHRGGAPLRAVPVATGLAGPSGFTFGPGGTIWYLERGSGQIRIITPRTGRDRLFGTLSAVDGSGERGALGIALHPDYPASPFVFVYVTRRDGGPLVNEVLRIRAENGHAAGRRALFKWRPNVSTCCHNGGRILFGPDGNLWIVTGENGNPAFSQQRDNLRGKILRIRPGGGVPSGNPFGSRVYAFGIRNSFGMTFDPRTDRLWESENGPSCNDEINLIRRGGNFAWGPNESCGSMTAPRDTNRDGPQPRLLPKAFLGSTVGLTGLAFCDGCRLGGGREGDLFVGDVVTGSVRVYRPNGARTDVSGGAVVLTMPGGNGIHSMEVSPRGRIYVSTASGIFRLART
jgi:glucose/arabinose dehydrogenase